jgi:hypothetical protein
MYRVSSPGLKIAQKVMRHCQSAVGSYHPRGIVLRPRQRINPLGNLYRCCELVVHEGVAPLTHQCHVQKYGTIKRMTPGLCALVTNPRFRCSHTSRGRQVQARLHEDEELIFRRETRPSTPTSTKDPQRLSWKK